MEHWFIAYGGFWGSIIGGVIGGLVTFAGVWLTLDSQKKSDYPKKLGALSDMMFALEEYEKYLDMLIEHIYKQYPNCSNFFTYLELKDLKSAMISSSLNVDKETYRIVIDSFLLYFQKQYEKVTEFEGSYDNNLFSAEELAKELPILKMKINNRISYYEDKLK